MLSTSYDTKALLVPAEWADQFTNQPFFFTKLFSAIPRGWKLGSDRRGCRPLSPERIGDGRRPDFEGRNGENENSLVTDRVYPFPRRNERGVQRVYARVTGGKEMHESIGDRKEALREKTRLEPSHDEKRRIFTGWGRVRSSCEIKVFFRFLIVMAPRCARLELVIYIHSFRVG